MKFLKQGLSLALVGGVLAALPAGGSASAAPDSLMDRMKNEATGAVKVTTERANGKVGFIRAKDDLMPSVDGDSKDGAAKKASAYLGKYAGLFGASSAELKQSRVSPDEYGWTVDFKQVHRGVEVFGARLRAHVDRDGDLTSVNGFAAPALNVGVTPRIGKAAAATRAVQIVRAKPAPGDAEVSRSFTAGLKAKATDLRIYKMGSTRGDSGASVLTWVVEVTNGTTMREMVFLDANSGKQVNRYSMMTHALDRELYEASINNGGTPDDDSDDTVARDLVWKEGQPFPGTLDEDQRNLVEGSGDSYWFFRNSFGRDSYDGMGAKMRTVNNDPTIACPNANWNGVTTNYCSGVTSDDTVAHEWGHAYTEYTSGLVYQWQSGAMNEAFSDIWGESVDMINSRMNENEPVRAVGNCSTHTSAQPLLTINAPSTIAKDCMTGGLLGSIDTPVTADVAAPTDAVETGGTATDGCSPYTGVTGKIVLVDRGLCTFVEKAQQAKAAGAAAVIIGNRDEAPVSFSDADTTLPLTVSIGLSDRQSIRTAILAGSTVNVTIKDNSGPREDSYRWLSGENDPAFGGAIRDMWNPTCLGDPGKVSDAEYKCSTDDSGGVHSNSGVVNHAYALLVDGGTYNGVTVAGLGLTKAAQIFWRTQANYLTPISDFTDLADGLAASCADLTGKGLNELSTDPMTQEVSDEVIAAGDCAAVTAVAAAVELTKDPTAQCEFEPLLKKNAPSLCGKGFTTRSHYRENFEDGLKGWTASQEIVFAGGVGVPWKSAAAPGRSGKAAFAPDPTGGVCSEGAGDLSARNSITSPAITIPNGSMPKLSFDHYVATEYGYDGGNVKVSVAGGAFKVIPTGAYTFNAPGATLDPEGTGPMAGEEAFTGSDGGQPTGSWGKSIVDLKKVGKAGQKIRLRLDFNRDGCSGLDGWYVDNIAVTTCTVATKLTARSKAAKAPKVTVNVRRTGVSGAAPSGRVTVTKGKTIIGRGVLRKGKVVITLKKKLKVGAHKVRVNYLGNATFNASRAVITVRYKKR